MDKTRKELRLLAANLQRAAEAFKDIDIKALQEAGEVLRRHREEIKRIRCGREMSARWKFRGIPIQPFARKRSGRLRVSVNGEVVVDRRVAPRVGLYSELRLGGRRGRRQP